MSETNKKQVTAREFIGLVLSTAMNKTIVVDVERRKMHPKYKKSYRVNRKYHVHDEKGVAKVGDKVKFVECRPLSKTKRWRLAGVISSV
ncbi:MAG: 30S ribosomal protein S17 [Patescibacteria group bacterium]|nr:30S ribosomal protein S17 [Patescibacteria group bacterium]